MSRSSCATTRDSLCIIAVRGGHITSMFSRSRMTGGGPSAGAGEPEVDAHADDARRAASLTASKISLIFSSASPTYSPLTISGVTVNTSAPAPPPPGVAASRATRRTAYVVPTPAGPCRSAPGGQRHPAPQAAGSPSRVSARATRPCRCGHTTSSRSACMTASSTTQSSSRSPASGPSLTALSAASAPPITTHSAAHRPSSRRPPFSGLTAASALRVLAVPVPPGGPEGAGPDALLQSLLRRVGAIHLRSLPHSLTPSLPHSLTPSLPLAHSRRCRRYRQERHRVRVRPGCEAGEACPRRRRRRHRRRRRRRRRRGRGERVSE